ncbi:MAG: hypothetical protein A2W97_04770 [Bacteroidetes bacterium GWE2_40_63]|nr:MAG: hypothetical protein A2W84_09195 [Bacteroidetes bacterium GWC2_40_13]OFX73037.1 MAG: hypothetical protein A2W96_13180 [Bacteroidetes bacterium GWD2_40_43]OFX91515.1 MAG: hypothetical protein A2W97_04770 [Bacteroidetes bacterium GWE2_40_63]OFY19677.1 MAG: hypothetical protein A2W88_02660 [Bacteroidetes bacterium GWF2_40_13]HBX86205.1 hypothetical protein [Marinilabiliales bacterium]
MRGRQCLKMLYLFHHKRELIPTLPKKQDAVLKKGFGFEKQVQKNLFPKGFNMRSLLGNAYSEYHPHTQRILAAEKQVTLFEAGIISQQVLVLVDVLRQNEDGTLDIFEIKNSFHLKSNFLWDAGLQYFVCKSYLGPKLNGFNLVLKGHNQPFKVIDITPQLEKRLAEVQQDLELLASVIKEDKEPDVAMGKHCSVPYSCGFIGYCKGLKTKK